MLRFGIESTIGVTWSVFEVVRLAPLKDRIDQQEEKMALLREELIEAAPTVGNLTQNSKELILPQAVVAEFAKPTSDHSIENPSASEPLKGGNLEKLLIELQESYGRTRTIAWNVYADKEYIETLTPYYDKLNVILAERSEYSVMEAARALPVAITTMLDIIKVGGEVRKGYYELLGEILRLQDMATREFVSSAINNGDAAVADIEMLLESLSQLNQELEQLSTLKDMQSAIQHYWQYELSNAK